MREVFLETSRDVSNFFFRAHREFPGQAPPSTCVYALAPLTAGNSRAVRPSSRHWRPRRRVRSLCRSCWCHACGGGRTKISRRGGGAAPARTGAPRYPPAAQDDSELSRPPPRVPLEPSPYPSQASRFGPLAAVRVGATLPLRGDAAPLPARARRRRAALPYCVREHTSTTRPPHVNRERAARLLHARGDVGVAAATHCSRLRGGRRAAALRGLRGESSRDAAPRCAGGLAIGLHLSSSRLQTACGQADPRSHCFMRVGDDSRGLPVVYSAAGRASNKTVRDNCMHMAFELERLFDGGAAAGRYVWIIDFRGFGMRGSQPPRRPPCRMPAT